jgi:hypothetical protein
MINQYIRDPQLKTLWDIKQPHIRTPHERMMQGWTLMVNSVRDNIRKGVKPAGAPRVWSLHGWVWGNLSQLHQEGPADWATQGAPYPNNPNNNSRILQAYLRWGTDNYPITKRITDLTLEWLEHSKQLSQQPANAWITYVYQVNEIIDYQTERNQKPLAMMNRAELMRWMTDQPEETIRKMAAAVEYQRR